MIPALLVAAHTVAVLEFRDKVPKEQRIDAAYLSDQVRTAVKELLPDAKVITRENMLVLLEASGKKLEECEGECEVDTGRRIGADLVVSGELLRFGTQYKLNMKLHDTRSGELLSGAVAAGTTADELDRALRPAVAKLLAPLMQTPRSAPREAAKERPYKTVIVAPWGTIGYASTGTTNSLAASTESGFAYGFGGQVFVHVSGPLYLGVLADYSILPAPGGGKTNGFLGGGGVHFDLGDAAVDAGAGWASLSDGFGSGYGLLGAVEYGVFRFQFTWRHVDTTVLQVTAVDRVTNAFSGQAGLQVTF